MTRTSYCKLSPETWAKVHLSAEAVDKLIESKEIEVTKGDAAEAARVLNLFDRYDAAQAAVVPLTLIQNHR